MLSFNFLGSSTILIPLPPPPAEALTRIGYPIFFASLASEVIGRVGTPAFSASFLEVILSPIFLMTFPLGPIQMIPAFFTEFANPAFSDKKPYPG